MTFLVVNLIGIGFIFIASSLDNSSLKDTFLKVINGDSINWSGAPIDPQSPKSQDGPPNTPPSNNPSKLPPWGSTGGNPPPSGNPGKLPPWGSQ